MNALGLSKPEHAARRSPTAGRRWAYPAACCLLLLSFGAQLHGQEADGDDRLTQARTAFEKKIASSRWIAYSPSTFRPYADSPLFRSDVGADLKLLNDAGFDGLVTYSCVRRRDGGADDEVGFHDIPGLARAAGFNACIVGIWDLANDDEIESAVELARNGLADAICVGNEGLDVRYGWSELVAVMSDVRSRGGAPCSTTEQVDDYSRNGLRNPKIVDFILPNVHPLFQNIEDPTEAAAWTVSRVQELQKLDADRNTRLPLLIKETGMPSQGLPYLSEANQLRFWRAFNKRAMDAKLPYAVFEGFDQPWKDETHQGQNIGKYWGVFTADRQAKPAALADIKAPVFERLATIRQVCDRGKKFATIRLTKPKATDDFPGKVVVTTSAGSRFQLGTTTVVWSAEDKAGNVSRKTQKVIVTNRRSSEDAGSDATDEGGEEFARMRLSGETATASFAKAADAAQCVAAQSDSNGSLLRGLAYANAAARLGDATDGFLLWEEGHSAADAPVDYCRLRTLRQAYGAAAADALLAAYAETGDAGLRFAYADAAYGTAYAATDLMAQ